MARKNVCLFTLFTAALMMLGCSGGSQPATGVRPVASGRRLSVEVENQNFYDATIYAYDQGSRKRLGIVDSEGSRSFTFSWTTGNLRFLVDFFANGCILTDPLFVESGDDILVVLQPQDFRMASQDVCNI
ncbi:MAG: hypothetical protein O7I93_02040 [Gemmatimonadetes bacterium]|nr:hypothetical protein [Gemmatimonadota bacterium]